MINERYAKEFCCEDISKIENYKQAVNDKTQTWECHHRLEIQGQFRNSRALLKKCGLYYNVPAWQLIFLTKSEHRRLHLLGGHLSKETRKKMSMSLSGKHKSEETKKKMSIAHSGEKGYWYGKHHSEETKKKISLSNSGKSSWNKGKHLSDETKKKQADAFKGTHWWNNGIVSKQLRECPGEGWVRGRLKRKNHK